jgi:hypothetical protein
VVFAVTGGTGDYRDARGQATLEFETDGDVVVTYELDTTRWQVSEKALRSGNSVSENPLLGNPVNPRLLDLLLSRVYNI